MTELWTCDVMFTKYAFCYRVTAHFCHQLGTIQKVLILSPTKPCMACWAPSSPYTITTRWEHLPACTIHTPSAKVTVPHIWLYKSIGIQGWTFSGGNSKGGSLLSSLDCHSMARIKHIYFNWLFIYNNLLQVIGKGWDRNGSNELKI